MAALDKEKKSSRLLASRRYTHETLNDSQEAFTEVLDIGASEVYTQADKIPSSGLPFSGSSQNRSIFTVDGKNIMKYYYRQKMTKSNTNNEVWFFLDPTGSDSGIGAQLIDSNQKTNFISPKYSTPALATSTTEDSTPGYLAVLYKTSAVSQSSQTGSLSISDKVSTNDYVFDYKTGVVQFNSSGVDPTDSEYVYMSVVQYVGTTLEQSVNISQTGSFGRIEATAITASRVDVDSGTIAVGGQPINSTLVQNISNTFSTTEVQSAGETTGSFGRVEANVIQANQYVVSSSVTEITTQQISGSTLFGDSLDDTHQRTGSLGITGSLSLDATAFRYGSSTWKEISGVNEFTGSTWEFQANKGSGTLFNVVDNSNNLVFKAQQDKVFVFGAVDGAEPTAIAGGLMYSGSDAWYLGYENDPQ